MTTIKRVIVTARYADGSLHDRIVDVGVSVEEMFNYLREGVLEDIEPFPTVKTLIIRLEF